MALEEAMSKTPEGMDDENEREDGPEDMTDEEEDDLRIAVTLAEDLIDQGGYDIIEKALSTKDPGTIIGQFIMQLVSQMGESLPEGVTLSPRIFFAYGGVVEQISDYLQEEYGVSKEIMDRAEKFIGAAAQEMAAGQQAQQQQAPQQAAPALPQGAM